MSAQPAPVVWFDDVVGDARALVGGKSASLVEMRRASFPVPPGFAITVSAFEQFGEETGVNAQIERIVAAIEPDSMQSLRVASEQIQALAEDVRLPADLLRQIEREYQRMAQETGEDEPAVAVRSSAVGEDSAEASFAGQQETYLWVQGIWEVEQAVRRCWASYFSPPALSYRARLSVRNPGLSTVGMSVAVQQMVDADVAGVMFTRSPTTDDRSIVAIEAGLGLGVSVVGGEVTPDDIWVNKVTREIVKRKPGHKQLRYVPDRESGGTRCEEVPEDQATGLCLDDDTAKRLAEYGVQLERHHGAAQDIEWALTWSEDSPKLVLLQSRPITTARKRSEPVATPLPSRTDYVLRQLLASSKKKVQM
jgi:pyruvate, water dikinase